MSTPCLTAVIKLTVTQYSRLNEWRAPESLRLLPEVNLNVCAWKNGVHGFLINLGRRMTDGWGFECFLLKMAQECNDIDLHEHIVIVKRVAEDQLTTGQILSSSLMVRAYRLLRQAPRHHPVVDRKVNWKSF